MDELVWLVCLVIVICISLAHRQILTTDVWIYIGVTSRNVDYIASSIDEVVRAI